MARSFAAWPLPDGARDRILNSALRAPSAGFRQGWARLVLNTPADTARCWDAVQPERDFARGGWPGVYNAPVVIVPLAQAGVSRPLRRARPRLNR